MSDWRIVLFGLTLRVVAAGGIIYIDALGKQAQVNSYSGSRTKFWVKKNYRLTRNYCAGIDYMLCNYRTDDLVNPIVFVIVSGAER